MKNKLYNISKKIETGFESVVQKSEDLIETSRINSKISSEENKIEEIYISIGKKILKKFKDGKDIDKEFVDKCKEILNYEKNIEFLKKKILKVKNRRPCKNCGGEMDKDALFCPTCGSKQQKH